MAPRRQRALPKVLSQAKASALLSEHGWVQTLGGKHVVKMEKVQRRPITLPYHKGRDYGPALTDAIYREAGLKGPSKRLEEQ
jgi:predicted RNA binding protein YcfA (HicA-like mRNA interferase family)